MAARSIMTRLVPAALLLTLLPGAAAAQSGATVTAPLLDRFLASYAEARAEERRRYPDAGAGNTVEDEFARMDEYDDCRDEIVGEKATAAERATIERLQRAMQPYAGRSDDPRYAALVDSATAVMRAVEGRAAADVRAKCGPSREEAEAEEAEAAAAEAESEEDAFNVDDATADALGLDYQAYGRLMEKITMFLAAPAPQANDLWTAAELKVLAEYRARLAAALE